ncbi:MAG TPA: UDP-3-O-(3-hydroxymyristoyl)glucosamine N-acyltransferase [Candidatus Omnitrophota bacterium]|nr:UDP-3-O-(3-hydroxymyristoyl)glucosamine N-acyltransferase [Candidatus Omnitrophota bacterium]
MQKTIREIAQYLSGKVQGDEHVVIRGISGIKEACEGDITFVANAKYFPLIEVTKASAIIAPSVLSAVGKNLIIVDNPSLAFAKIVSYVLGEQEHCVKGIHPTAVIAPDAKIGKNVHIGAYAVIENKAVIGDETIIYSGCFIGHETVIGQKCLLYPNVVIRERVSIGCKVIIHSGTVIGADGFGFANVEGVHYKIPQVGTVVVEDDVEIGANVTVDRARFDKTFIGQGTKIDNLVQIAHNVIIGRHCIIVAQAGISGSVEIKDGAILAGQSGIAGHLTIGEGAVVAAQAGVTKSVPAKTFVSGYPAKPHEKAKKVNAALQRLPEYVKTIQELKQKIILLEKKVSS